MPRKRENKPLIIGTPSDQGFNVEVTRLCKKCGHVCKPQQRAPIKVQEDTLHDLCCLCLPRESQNQKTCDLCKRRSQLGSNP